MPFPRTRPTAAALTALTVALGLASAPALASPAQADQTRTSSPATAGAVQARAATGETRAVRDRVAVRYGRMTKVPVLSNDTYQGRPTVRVVRKSLPPGVRASVDKKGRIALRVPLRRQGKRVKFRYRLTDQTGRTRTARVVARDARALRRPAPRTIDERAIKRAKGPADRTCQAGNVRRCVVVKGKGPHIVIVGDSHGRVVAPAFIRIAKQRGFKLSLGIVSSCPWQDGVYNNATRASFRTQCRDFGETFYRQTLPAMDADLVVLANLARSHPSWRGKLVNAAGQAEPLASLQRTSTERTVDLIGQAGARALIVKSIMGTNGYDRKGFDPLACLQRARVLGDCMVSPHPALPRVDGVYDEMADSRAHVATLDINPMICPDFPSCSPVVDGRVVWRNNNHITAAMSRSLRNPIWREIRRTGFLS